MMWSTKLLCLALQVASSFSLPAEIPTEEYPSRKLRLVTLTPDGANLTS